MHHAVACRRNCGGSFACFSISIQNSFCIGRATQGHPVRDIRRTATGEPVALYITLCLRSGRRPAIYRELPLTLGAAEQCLRA